MCRYSSKDDDGYRKVVRKLQASCEKIEALRERKAAEKEAKKPNERERCQFVATPIRSNRILLTPKIVAVNMIDSGLNLQT
jgi:hypothetical protein